MALDVQTLNWRTGRARRSPLVLWRILAARLGALPAAAARRLAAWVRPRPESYADILRRRRPHLDVRPFELRNPPSDTLSSMLPLLSTGFSILGYHGLVGRVRAAEDLPAAASEPPRLLHFPPLSSDMSALRTAEPVRSRFDGRAANPVTGGDPTAVSSPDGARIDLSVTDPSFGRMEPPTGGGGGGGGGGGSLGGLNQLWGQFGPAQEPGAPVGPISQPDASAQAAPIQPVKFTSLGGPAPSKPADSARPTPAAPAKVAAVKPWVVTLRAVDTSATEPATPTGVPDVATFAVERSNGTGSVTVGYKVSGTAKNGKDYDELPGSVTFAPGQTVAVVTVTPHYDKKKEGAETVTLTLRASADYEVGRPRTATVTIHDPSKGKPVGHPDTISGGGGGDVVTVSAYFEKDGQEGRVTNGVPDPDGIVRIKEVGSPTTTVTAYFHWTGTATEGVVFSPSAVSSVQIPPSPGYVDIHLTPLPDDDDGGAWDGNKGWTLTVDSNPAYAVSHGVTSGLIKDATGETVPNVWVTAPDPNATEGTSDTGTFVVHRSSGTGSLQVYFNWQGTAAPAVDYGINGTGSGPNSVTMSPGTTAVTYTLNALADDAGEAFESGAGNLPTETATLALVSSSAYHITSPGEATVTIAEHDPPPTPPTVSLDGWSTDTGYSTSDNITNDQHPHFYGTVTSGSTVEVQVRPAAGGNYADYGSATVTGGTWSLTTGGPPAQAADEFRAKATKSGLYGYSSSQTIQFDFTNPLVSLNFPNNPTTSHTPPVQVSASDWYVGFPPGATVLLDVDLNHNGVFTDPGESGYASGTLVNQGTPNFTQGVANFNITPGLAAGTYSVEARVQDKAGNEGTSSPQSITISYVATTITIEQHSPSELSVNTNPVYVPNASATLPLDVGLFAASCGCQYPTLFYNSLTADPRPIVQVVIGTSSTGDMPLDLLATMTWDNGTTVSTDPSLSGFGPGSKITLAFQVPTAQTTGRHRYTVDVTGRYHQSGTTDPSASVSDKTFVVNEQNSDFGAGWAFGYDQLFAVPADTEHGDPDGELLFSPWEMATGVKGWHFFADSGGSYTSQDGDPGTLVQSGGQFVYTSAEGEESIFNSSGQMVKWLGSNGVESFVYDYSGSQLTQITNAANAVATFTYTSGMATTLTGPAGPTSLVATLSYAATTGGIYDLTQVAKPAGGTRTFAYDTGHRMTLDSDGIQQQGFAFDGNGVLSEIIPGNMAANDVQPAIAQGLNGPVNGFPVGQMQDGLGHPTQTLHDGDGRPLRRTAPDGGVRTWTYDSHGWVQTETDELGRTTTYAYDGRGNATSVVYPNGSQTTAAFDSATSQPLTQTDELNHTTTYQYNANHELTLTIDPLGRRTTSTYNAAGLEATETDPAGLTTTYAYDSLNRLTTETLPGGRTTTYAWDASGLQEVTTDPTGAITTVNYDAAYRELTTADPAGGVTTNVYDSSGLLIGTVAPTGMRTSYAYNARGDQTAVTEAVGTALQRQTTSAFDAAGELTASTDSLGRTTTYAYDSVGRQVSVEDPLQETTLSAFDQAGELTATTDALGRTTTFAYDLRGRQTTATDPLGNTITTVYDAAGQVIATVDGLGRRTTTVYDAAGEAIATVDPTGARTTTIYDATTGRVTATEDALSRFTTTIYDATTGRVAATEDPLLGLTTTAYDAADRVVATTDPLGRTTTYQYDLAGRQTTVEDPLTHLTASAYDTAGQLTATTDADGRTTTYQYDILGRQTAVRDPANQLTTTAYDAADQVTATTDPLGRTTTYQYDLAGRQTAVEDPLTNTTTTAYDAAGEVTATQDALGNTTTYQYDLAGRQTTVEDPLTNTTTSAYDAAGELTATTDPLTNTTTFLYDLAGRLTETQDALSQSAFTRYDDVGNVTVQIDATGARTTYIYDALDRATTTIDPLGFRTTAAYDAAGQLTASVDALTRTTAFEYDAAGQQTAVVDPQGHRATTVYDAAGQVINQVDVLDRTTTFAYDSLGRQTAVTDPLRHTATTEYDAAGQVTAQVDALDRRTTFQYDAAGRETLTQDALGNLATTVYDAAGQVVERDDPLDRPTLYYYDPAGQLTLTIGPAGDPTATAFDATGNSTLQTDALGNQTTYQYDALNRVTAVVDPLSHETDYAYDADGRRTAVTDPRGHTTTTVYDAAGQVVATVDALDHRTTFEYDAAGQQTAVVDALNHRTTFEYDTLGRQTATIDALNHQATVAYDAAGNAIGRTDVLSRTTTLAYDALDRLTQVENPLSGLATTAYDAVGNTIATTDELGRTTTFAYDALDRVTSTEDALTHTATVAYDADGEMTSRTDVLGHTTQYAYDDGGNLTLTTDAGQNAWQSTFDLAGNRLTAVDPLNRVTTYAYDADNQLTTTTDAQNNVTTFAYDAAGNRTKVDDPTGAITTYAYDALDRVTRMTDPLHRTTDTGYDEVGNVITRTDGRGATTTYAYDELGRMTQATDPLNRLTTTVYDAAGQVVQTIDGADATTSYAYDLLGRLTRTERPTGGVETVAYDAVGNTTASTDGLNRTSTFAYDALDRRVAATDPLGQTTTTAYDAAGQVTQVEDPSANRTTYAYDALGHVTTQTDPLGHTTTTVYDEDGRVIVRTDPLGRRIEDLYDEVGNLVSEDWFASPTSLIPTQSTAFGYDADGRLTAAWLDAGGSPDLSYYLNRDLAGQVTNVVEPFGLTLSMAYDAAGNRTAVQDNLGGTTTSTYDLAGELTSRSVQVMTGGGSGGSGGGTVTQSLRWDEKYDGAGDPTGVTRYGDVAGTSPAGTTTYAYDAGERLTTIQEADGTGALFSTLTYGYDAADQVTAQQVDGTTTSYAYDADGQLIKDGSNPTVTYDATGNRTVSGYATTTGNEMTSDGTWAYTYDNAGNVIEKSKGAGAETWTYAYDNANRLSVAEDRATPGGTLISRVEYGYDALGNRAWRKEYNGSLTLVKEEHFGYDGWDPARPAPVGNENFDAWADLDGTDTLVMRRVYGDGVDQPMARFGSGGGSGGGGSGGGIIGIGGGSGGSGGSPPTGGAEWYRTDRLGSIREVTDDGGVPEATVAYDAFGNVISNSALTVTDRYLYTAREWDSTLGLQDNRDREYDPATGRFNTADPLGLGAGDVNVYRYVGNGYNWGTDPSGADPTVARFPIEFPDNSPGQPYNGSIFEMDPVKVFPLDKGASYQIDVKDGQVTGVSRGRLGDRNTAPANSAASLVNTDDGVDINYPSGFFPPGATTKLRNEYFHLELKAQVAVTIKREMACRYEGSAGRLMQAIADDESDPERSFRGLREEIALVAAGQRNQILGHKTYDDGTMIVAVRVLGSTAKITYRRGDGSPLKTQRTGQYKPERVDWGAGNLSFKQIAARHDLIHDGALEQKQIEMALDLAKMTPYLGALVCIADGAYFASRGEHKRAAEEMINGSIGLVLDFGLPMAAAAEKGLARAGERAAANGLDKIAAERAGGSAAARGLGAGSDLAADAEKTYPAIVPTKEGDRRIFKQGPNPWCTAVCCEMAADSVGRWMCPGNLVTAAHLEGWLTEDGMKLEHAVELLGKYESISARYVVNQSVRDLTEATLTGRPAIVSMRTGDPKSPLHAVVVDGVTVREGQTVVVIRNPHGKKEKLPIGDFEKDWTGKMVIITQPRSR